MADALTTALFVRAAEESDPEGRILPLATRERAGREAGGPPVGEDPEAARAWIESRAAILSRSLERDHPGLALARDFASLGVPVFPLVGLAFVLGLLADALGRSREVNLLALSLLGLLGWNAIVLLGQPLAILAGRRAGAGLSALARRVALFVSGRGASGDARRFQRDALLRGIALVNERAGALIGLRARAGLHAAAAAFALGVIVSLYAAGFAFEYRATWESTFLSAEGTARLLGTLLAPASMLLGLPTPDTALLAPLRAPASGEAASWIHRWAVTVALFIVLPRIVLATVARVRADALAARLGPDLESPYALRLLSSVRGGREGILVLPYSAALSPRAADRVRDLCLELFGARAGLTLHDMVAYGDELPDLPEAHHCVVVFDVAQTPEHEVHGRFVEEAMRAVDGPGPERLLVLLEEERFRQRNGEERGEERRRSWLRLLRESGLSAAPLPTDGAGGDALAAARDALWPEAA